MNYYKRHLGDYAKAAGHLTMLEHGAYTLLLDRYYTTERPIAGLVEAYRVCRARTAQERAAVDAVLAEFFTTDDAGSFRNRRADEELAKASHQRTVNQEIGKRGGRPRKTDSVSEEITESVSDRKTESVSEQNPSHYSTTPLLHNSTSEAELPQGESAAKSPRPSRKAPAGFLVDAPLQQWAREHVPSVDIRAETDKFRDHTFKNPISDWPGAWRNWMRRADEPVGAAARRHGRGNGTPSLSAEELFE